MAKHYLYRHIRLDKNEPFYIGIGTKRESRPYTSDNAEYSRAHTKNKRTSFWKKITTKTEYEVEILLESDDYEFIKQKEIEFIALYGRRDLAKGTLCNLTDGGDGRLGTIKSQEERESISKRQLGSLNHMYGKIGELSPIYGTKHTEERVRNSKIFGLNREDDGSKLLLDIFSGIFYKNAREASEVFSININTLRAQLNGTRENKTNLIQV
jgi:hypothetical protein